MYWVVTQIRLDEFENTFLSFIVSYNEVVAVSIEQCFMAGIIEMPRGPEHGISRVSLHKEIWLRRRAC